MSSAILHVSEECLDELLSLPEGMHVSGVHFDPSRRGFMFRVSGKSLPYTEQGQCYPEIQAVYKRGSGLEWCGYRLVRYGEALK